MPHSTSETLTNGDSSPSSKTLSKLTSYPTVATGIDTVKSHPYGKKSIELVDQAYNRFGKPVEPYLETPYQYAKPYVNKADELGDKALGTIEGHFPIVKEDPETIWETGKSWAFAPYNYAVDAFYDEYGKVSKRNNNQKNLWVLVQSIVSFQLRVVSDTINIVAAYAKPKYEESKKKSGDYVALAHESAEEARKYAADKAAEAKKLGEQYAGLAQEKGEQYTKTAQDKGEQYAQTAQQKGEEVKGEAEKTKDQAKESAKKSK